MLAPYRQKVIECTKPLTLWQRLYFVAFFLLIFEVIFSGESVDFTLPGIVALAALSIEVWPKFVTLWESIIGRVLIISTYIVVGNFAVAAASHQLNQIVGIDPSSLFYATGFVSVLMAPVWIITITLIGMLVYVIAKYMWFLITFLPWIIGLYEKTGYRVDKLPKTTRAVRIVMLPVMFMSLISVLELYNEDDDFVAGVQEGLQNGKQVGEQIATVDEAEPLEVSSNSSEQEVKDTESKQQEEQVSADKVEVNGVEVTGWVRGQKMNRLIATFVYYIEGFKYSQCEKTEQERVVSLGEYDILAIEPDDSEFGYRFTVRACKLKSYPTEPATS